MAPEAGRVFGRPVGGETSVGEGCNCAGVPTLPARAFAQLLDFDSEGIALGGHRGMGANPWCALTSQRLPARFRENTVRSMQHAAGAGVTFMEFDVQVTSDDVPVVWHDTYVVAGDPSQPESRLIADMSLAEFRLLAPINGHLELADPALMEARPATSGSGSNTGGGGTPPSSRAALLRQHRNDEPAVSHEPTLRAWEVDEEDQLPILAEVFAALPSSIAFDIEVKMTTPHTQMHTDPAEIDRVLNATLATVDAALAAQPRLVMFSSFDPDVCLELRLRRPHSAVFFLTGGGAYAHVDPRRTSVASAIEFASASELQGVIVDSYGKMNDDPAWVHKQRCLGVHGVIVDDVESVSRALSAAV